MQWLTRTGLIAALACLGLATGPAIGAEPPERVVSMNVCTDQLALLIAAPGQLHSVSWQTADPAYALLAHRTKGLELNSGLAEEIFLMKPDLVLTGTFSNRTTTTLLSRLGFRVEEFAPAATFDDIRTNLARMGDLLSRQAEAQALIAELDAGIAAMQAVPRHDLTLAFYQVNNYTTGAGTLADDMVDLAGLRHLGRELGYAGTVRLPLELLVEAAPDLVIGGARHDRIGSRSQAGLSHPAYRAVAASRREVDIDGRYWLCGAPFTLEAARQIAAHADAVQGDE